jgi:hypothetical protein
MKKLLPILLVFALFCGCVFIPTTKITQSAPVGSPILSSEGTLAQTPIAPTPIASPLITVKNTPTPEPTDNNYPNDMDSTPQPAPTPNKPLPSAAPGPGLKVGQIVISHGNEIYYYDQLYRNDAEESEYIALYELNKNSGKKSVIREVEDCTMVQIFFDNSGNLYYVTESFQDSKYRLYKYLKSGDLLIAILENNGTTILRVDDDYIYTDTVWYSIKDYKPVLGDDTLFTTWQDGDAKVQYVASDSMTQFTITDTRSGTVQKCSINENIESAGANMIVGAYVHNGILYVFNSYFDEHKSTIYAIDITKNTYEKSHVNADITSSCYHDGMVYFCYIHGDFSSIYICSYNIANRKISLLHKFNDPTGEEYYPCVDVEGGYLWAFMYGSPDLEGYFSPHHYVLN